MEPVVDSARALELGAELREAREKADIGTRELARRAGLSTHAGISLWENGRRLPSVGDLDKVLDVLGATEQERDRLLGMVREAQGPGQFTAGVPSIGQQLAQLIEYERTASRIIDVAPLLIPGLLQTSDYARAIMGEGPSTETRVTLRSGRRDVLTRRAPVALLALIDSEVLTRPVARQDVMADQLRHLLEMADRPNVTIQLMSGTRLGWHPGLAGPFELIEFPKARPIVHLEHHRSSVFLWEKKDVAEYMEAAEMVRKVAMTPVESAEAIAFIVNGMETKG